MLCLAEQNNGYILQNLLKDSVSGAEAVVARRRATSSQSTRWTPKAGRRFIHSGTYEELTRAFGLAPRQSQRSPYR